MAQPFLSRFFGRPQSRDPQRREENLQRAYEAGPPSMWERLAAPLLGNEYVSEWKRQRKAVRDTYWTNKKRLTMERQRAERELKKDLERETKDIERYYRLHEVRSDDPRFNDLRKKADYKIELMTRQSTRNFRRSSQERLRELQRERDHQYKEITQNLNRPRFE